MEGVACSLMGASAPGRDDETGRPAETCVGSSKRGRAEESRGPSYQDGRRACSSTSAVCVLGLGAGGALGRLACGGTEGSAGKAHSRGCGLRVAGCGQNKRKA
jgi:hypothetical protein